ncbi:MAG: methyltransferase domain-containing protein [Armatimonadota bacterium]
MISQAEYFDSYADRWDSMELDDIRIRLDSVVRMAGVKPGMDILDVGTGTGVIIPCLLKAMNGIGSIKAIDISQGMLRVAHSKGFPGCVEFQLADIEKFSCPDHSYDRVMCNAVFPHFSNKIKVLYRILQMLKPGGMVIISHPTGREAVNKVHSEAGAVVTEDRVPDAGTMQSLLENAGYVGIEVVDEPEFYLAIGRTRDQQQFL